MTVMNELQMREVSGAGFFDGFMCGAAIGALISVAASPDPVSKFALGTLWASAIGSCGRMVM